MSPPMDAGLVGMTKSARKRAARVWYAGFFGRPDRDESDTPGLLPMTRRYLLREVWPQICGMDPALWSACRDRFLVGLRGHSACQRHGLALDASGCPRCGYQCPTCKEIRPYSNGGTDSPDCDECWAKKRGEAPAESTA